MPAGDGSAVSPPLSATADRSLTRLPWLTRPFDSRKQGVMQVLEDRYQKYKPLYRAWIGPIAEIHLTLPEHVEVIMSTPKFLQKSHSYKFLQPWLGEGLLTSTGKKKRLAFLDLLLEASENGTKLSDQDIREEVDTFMFEGHDTTTAGICWSLLLLGEHQDVQTKVAEELDAIFDGSERAATMRDVQEMKYLERVVKEALRLYPSVPFVGRALPEDAHVAGHVLPAGAVVNLHIFHVHRDARNWPDPERFDPDRFLPENARGRHPYAYIPFSAGPRNCVGQKFALLEEKTLLSAVLRKFHVHTTEKRDALTLMNELILRPESGIQLQLTPRH
ncbi:Cytochrome P450 6j1 [Gryllus bimaculatus]|nr:Cytochrome P450 6j1 [Gryllus bimaculatus]